MTWLSTNALPRYWFSYPSDDTTPDWAATNTGAYGANQYAVATVGNGYNNLPARLLSNKFTVPTAGATVTFKLYVPTISDGAVYTVTVRDATTDAALTIAGLTAGAGWKDCSVSLTEGVRCLEFRVSPNVYVENFPKFVLDEVVSTVSGVQANLLELGGDGFTFPPGHQVPIGWENTGLSPFEPLYEPILAMRPTAYPGVLRLEVWEPPAGWFGELLSHAFAAPSGGITISATFTRSTTYNSSWAESSVAELVLCDEAGAPTGVVQSTTLAAPETHYTVTLFVPEGVHRARFRVRTPVAASGSTPYFSLNLTQVTPELVAQGSPPIPPYSMAGWLAAEELPPGWFNAPRSTGFLYPPDAPQPQWAFVGSGPYALQVVGGAEVDGTTARLLTNVFTVPSGGELLTFKFFNTAVDSGNGEIVTFLNRSTLGMHVTNISWNTPSYTAFNFDSAETGWQTVTLSLPEGANCIEIYVKRNSWASADTKYILDGVTSSLINGGGIGIGFPYGYRVPAGWQNTGAVPWVLGAEYDNSTGDLIVYTGELGVSGTQAGDYAEMLSHVFTVSTTPLTAECTVYTEYPGSFNPVFSVILCDDAGSEISTLYSQAMTSYNTYYPTFEVPVGTWSLRFRLEGDFSQPQSACYLDDVTPALIAQGGQEVETGVILMDVASQASLMNASGFLAIQQMTAASDAHLLDAVVLARVFSTDLGSACLASSFKSFGAIQFLWVTSSAVANDSFSTMSEILLVLQNLISGQDWIPLPSKDAFAWVVNAENGGSTRYDNFGYNSFAYIGGEYYGCKEDGIYALDGETDNGNPIQTMVSFGKQDFGTSALKRISNAYIGVSSTGKLVLRVIAEGATYDYVARDAGEALQTQRFDIGRGLRVNQLEFELYNQDGDDFEISAIEFAVFPTARRI